MRMIHNAICSLFDSTIFLHVIWQTAWFKKKIEHYMRIFIFSTIFVWNISQPKKNSAKYDHKRKVPVIRARF